MRGHFLELREGFQSLKNVDRRYAIAVISVGPEIVHQRYFKSQNTKHESWLSVLMFF